MTSEYRSSDGSSFAFNAERKTTVESKPEFALSCCAQGLYLVANFERIAFLGSAGQ